VGVAKPWDDLRLGVIHQSNLVIAGFLRNIFKYSGWDPGGGVACPWAQGQPRPPEQANTPPETPSQTWARKGATSRGKQPRPHHKVPNSSQVGKVAAAANRGRVGLKAAIP